VAVGSAPHRGDSLAVIALRVREYITDATPIQTADSHCLRALIRAVEVHLRFR